MKARLAIFTALLAMNCLISANLFAQSDLPTPLSDDLQLGLNVDLDEPQAPQQEPDFLPGRIEPAAFHTEIKVSRDYYPNEFDGDIRYNNGILLEILEDDQSFALKTNLRNQFRIINFSPDVAFWTDNTGRPRPVRARQDFDIERARLIFSGHAFTPKLKYFLQMDGDTDRGHFVTFFDYWWAWKFSDLFELRFGKRKVPGSRNWILGAFDTRLADRPFSTDFFRPGRTVGLWLVGKPTSSTYYELMAGAGYRTDNLTPAETNDEVAFSGTFWWDVCGDYQRLNPVDFEYHEAPAVRIGYSWTAATQGEQGRELPESDFLRLSDGTRLTETGALAPDATVKKFDVVLLSLDAAYKHRGCSMNAEYFMRWVEDIQADMPLPLDDLFQHGFYVEGGFFICPQELEINAHVARTTGKFGTTSSVAAGFSWYPRQTRYLKFTTDATLIDGSPVNSTGSDILVGDEGTLVRVQLQALF